MSKNERICFKNITTNLQGKTTMDKQKIIIREIIESDIPAFKSLIIEAFGEGWNFARYDQGTYFFAAAMDVYFSVFFSSATFGRVAVMDGKVVGAILCSAKTDTKKFIHLQGDMASGALALLTGAEAERNDLIEHLSNSFQAMGKLLESTAAHDGSLDFIAVTKEVQGLKIGKKLWGEAAKYFKSKKCKSVYLMTDTACNVGFYDYNGFTRIDETKARYSFTNGKKEIDLYLYEYKF